MVVVSVIGAHHSGNVRTRTVGNLGTVNFVFLIYILEHDGPKLILLPGLREPGYIEVVLLRFLDPYNGGESDLGIYSR